MKKKFILAIACFAGLTAFAQQENEDPRLANIDWKEDSTEITTVNDIINMQQEVTTRLTNEKHFNDVWGYRSFVNFSYNNAKLMPNENVPTGVPTLNKGLAPDFKSDWGASFQYGRSYRLHKKPIANTLQFNIDYTGIDLMVNHYKQEGDGKNLYDSNNKIDVKDDYGSVEEDKYYYIPWNLEKYEASFGMTLGPSVTIAPFNYVNVDALHFLKLNVYYHIGYQISGIYMVNDDEADSNYFKVQPRSSTVPAGSTLAAENEKYTRFEELSDNAKIEWGHGMMTSFGFNLSWKAIGIGYEHRTCKLKYKAISTKEFGDDKYEFKSDVNRIYLQIRM